MTSIYEREGFDLVMERYLGISNSPHAELIVREGSVVFSRDGYMRIFTPKKVEWTGEGLPPVGTVCEVKGCMSHYLQWNKVTVFAVRGKTVMFDMEDGRWGQTDSHEFRPIRTPEQIAAEERERDVAKMVEALGCDPDASKVGEFIRCGILYDAGYRKQV